MTTDADLQQAVSHHQAQRFPEAEQLYRAILLAEPDHPDANHNLGILSLQRQQPAAGLPFLKTALAAAPERAQYWSVYAEALAMSGQQDEALRVHEEAGLQGIRLAPLVAGSAPPAATAAPEDAPTPDQLDNLANEFVLTLETLSAKGLHDSAEALARQMLATFPENGYAWKTLAYAFLRRGDLTGALAPLEQATARQPHDAELLRHLGAARAMQEGLALDGRGEYQQAGKYYQAVLNVYPEHPDANHKLGVIAIRLLQPEAGLPYLERAIGGAPSELQYWANYIDGLLQANRLKAAWIALEMAQQRGLAGPAIDKLIGIMTVVSTQPTNKVSREELAQAPVAPAAVAATPESAPAPAQQESPTQPAKSAKQAPRKAGTRAAAAKLDQAQINALGELFNTGRVEEAIVAAREMTQRFPEQGFGWKVLVVALHRLARYDEALEHLPTAHGIWPNDIDVLQIMASVLESKGRHDEAEAACRRLLEMSPNRAEGHRILGIILQATGRLDEAEQVTRKAMQLDPNSSFIPCTLGVTLMQQGRLTDGIAMFRHALDMDPGFEMAYNNLVFCMTHSEGSSAAEVLAESRRFAERFEAPLKSHWPQHTNSRDPDRPLRIGFISGDFCRHAVASFLEPVLTHLALDPKLSLHAYSNTYLDDSMSERLRELFGHWNHVVGLSDEKIAEKVRADGIDILIDLAGHTAHNRLLTLARKPAPVQATWIGYPGTTGLESVDYFIADPLWVPSEQFRSQFTEKIAYLPAVAPFLADKLCPPVNGLPALHNGYITFGSFNRMDKLRRDVIALWSRLLREVPNSRMVLGAMPRDGSFGKLVEWFAEEGIARERLDFMPRSSVPVYLQQHYRVDFCLDSFPFSGLTTALHSLWMGVPTLTLPGQTVPGRSGLTAMSHVGLQAFVAQDKDDFVRKGVELAADVTALAALRTGMRERCQQSPVFRPEVIAASVTSALRVMWRRWCEGLAAESFAVSEVDAELNAVAAPGGSDVSASADAGRMQAAPLASAPVNLNLVRG
jgi:predicted O-linked N-acetylglucosamine transferase (SPINDLY family)